MALREEDLTMLFNTIEAIVYEIVEERLGCEPTFKPGTASKRKQDCINLIAFGEAPDDS